jgi:beta-glucosidase-like glycosyl hydrolase
MKKEIYFRNLNLKQKIAQMIIIRAEIPKTFKLIEEGIGGIFLDRQKSENNYKKIIKKFEKDAKIKLFVSTDMEGAWNPFKFFKKFPKFSEIKDEKQAYQIGFEQGRILKKIGFNLNFSPVAEYTDEVYGGRVFTGTKEEIQKKLDYYIKGLQKNVFAVCKHYPGKDMFSNLHLNKAKKNISKKDLDLFRICFKNRIKGIMISHLIVREKLNSKNKPSSVSKEVIDSLKNFKGLIISDEINMRGLNLFYLFNKRKKYRDLINSGENIILDFKLTYKTFHKLYKKLEKDIQIKKIDIKKIDESVKKILKTKGYKIK